MPRLARIEVLSGLSVSDGGPEEHDQVELSTAENALSKPGDPSGTRRQLLFERLPSP